MIRIGLIREGKIPADSRVALTPAQCKWIRQQHLEVKIAVQHSDTRCFADSEYVAAGIEVKEDISECDILFGIKEVPVDTYSSPIQKSCSPTIKNYCMPL
jgi:saccharopine dehydrogenase (NAD+, L-lysine-forming)